MRFLCEINTGTTYWELGRVHRVKERDVANWGERERMEMLRENSMGFTLRSTLVDFNQWSKSTQSIFGYRKWPYQQIYFATW